MSQRFHVTPKGQVRQCKAAGGGCPYGAEDHADSREAAEKRRDEKMRVEHGSGLSSVKRKADASSSVKVSNSVKDNGKKKSSGWTTRGDVDKIMKGYRESSSGSDGYGFQNLRGYDSIRLLQSVPTSHYSDSYPGGPRLDDALKASVEHPKNIVLGGEVTSSEGNEGIRIHTIAVTDDDLMDEYDSVLYSYDDSTMYSSDIEDYGDGSYDESEATKAAKRDVFYRAMSKYDIDVDDSTLVDVDVDRANGELIFSW